MGNRNNQGNPKTRSKTKINEQNKNKRAKQK